MNENIIPQLVLDKILLYHVSNRCYLCQKKFKEMICVDCILPLCSDCSWFCHKCGKYMCNRCGVSNHLNASLMCRLCYRDSLLTQCTICNQSIYQDDPGVMRCDTCSYHNEYLCPECTVVCGRCGSINCFNCTNACDMCWQKLCSPCMGDGTCNECQRHFFCNECLAENNGICIECVDNRNEGW
jgi:hypothetical protein